MEGFQFLSCIRFSIQLLAAESAFLILLPRRERFLIRLLCGVCSYLVLLWGLYCVVSRIPGDVLAVRIAYYTLVFSMTLVLIWSCFDLSLGEVLFAGVGGYATQHIIYGLVQLVRFSVGYDAAVMPGYLFHHWLPYLLIPPLFYWFIVQKKCNPEELKRRDPRMIWLALLCLLSTIVVSLLSRSGYVGDGNDFLQSVVCSIYEILCCTLELFLLFYIPREARLRHESEEMEQMIRAMDERLRVSKKNVEIINRKCHDIKYQLRVLMDTRDKNEQGEYVREISQAIAVYESTYQTGNAALDFVLCERGPIFQEEQIQFSCIADGTQLDFMQPLDVSTLFGNALDNAIESVAREPDPEKRIINLQVARRGEMVHIHVDNYCPAALTFEDGMPITTKAEKEYHGFGSRSIRYIVEKYDGILSFRQEKERFLLDAVCVIPQKQG